MAKKNKSRSASNGGNGRNGATSSPVDEMLLAAQQRGDDSLETGRYLITYKEGAGEQVAQSLGARGMRVADTRDFADQAVTAEGVGDADAVVFPEIGVALVGAQAAQARQFGAAAAEFAAADESIESVDPEYFMFAETVLGEYTGGLGVAGGGPGTGVAPHVGIEGVSGDYLRGFLRAAEAIARGVEQDGRAELEQQEEAQVLGATWGLAACRVPPSVRSGAGIRVAVLDTGMDLGHPDFTGRPIAGQTFVGQPVQDLNGHGTHCIGTATGPKAPPGTTPRYGIAYKSLILAGKVLSNSGSGSMAGVLAGMNWAIAKKCAVISMSLGAPIGPQPAYTAAGQAALNNGCLIIAAAGNSAAATGAPANSPTVMSVASLDPNLRPSSFSNFGKVEIAAPGRDVFSSWPRPTRYRIISGTSMATPHVAGCAALWAETSANLRGVNLRQRLMATARKLPFSPTRVGAGLVQAP